MKTIKTLVVIWTSISAVSTTATALTMAYFAYGYLWFSGEIPAEKLAVGWMLLLVSFFATLVGFSIYMHITEED